MSSEPYSARKHYSSLKAAIDQTLKFIDVESAWLQSQEQEAEVIREGEQAADAWVRHNGIVAESAIPPMPNRHWSAARRLAREVREQVGHLADAPETLAERRAAICRDVLQLQGYHQQIIPPDELLAMEEDYKKYGGLPRWFVDEQQRP